MLKSPEKIEYNLLFSSAALISSPSSLQLCTRFRCLIWRSASLNPTDQVKVRITTAFSPTCFSFALSLKLTKSICLGKLLNWPHYFFLNILFGVILYSRTFMYSRPRSLWIHNCQFFWTLYYITVKDCIQVFCSCTRLASFFKMVLCVF